MCYHDTPSVHLITWNQKDMGIFKVRNDNKSIWAHKDHLSSKDAEVWKFGMNYGSNGFK